LGLFRRRDFTAAQVCAFGLSASVFAGYLFMTVYLQEVIGLSPIQTGLTYLPGSIICFNPVLSGLALNSVDSANSGLAAGANDTFRQAGIAIGVAGLGAFLPAHAVKPVAFVGSFHHALLAAAALALVSSVVVSRLLAAGVKTATDALPQAA
jgi:hypothetical protein